MNKVLFSHKSDEWSTPVDLFDRLNTIYQFTLDPCASASNHLCDKYFTIDDDGLSKSWDNEIVFCNPPYSNISSFVDKVLSSRCFCVLLLPSRTDTKWFHRLLSDSRCTISFIQGRLRFGNSKNPAPFPSILVYFDNISLCQKI